jgi:hypothetical protein
MCSTRHTIHQHFVLNSKLLHSFGVAIYEIIHGIDCDQDSHKMIEV